MLAAALVAAVLAPQSPPQSPPPAPATRPERTAWEQTSTNADVAAFLADLARLPHGDRLRVGTIGATVQGRPLTIVRVARGAAGAPRLRALILANIHGGEVEGKEAVQVLLREVALGEHDDLLQHVDLAVVPVFNADGNDEIDRGNRVEQNGPGGGVGRRHNSQDRDLNRDCIKAETPEVRALLAVFAELDPHLFMDLHTTNGSHHGYHLTYCTSLNANTDPDLAALMHERLIPAVRARMQEAHGYRIFDYGNFGRGGPESGWSTFSADPRLAINYAGLRHCLSLLSEAYSYLSFPERIRVTHAFVLESLRELVARKDEVLELRALAEERAAQLPFRCGHELAPPVQGELLVGAVAEQTIAGLGKRLMAKPEFTAVQAPLRLRFTAKHEHALPAAWAIVGDFPLVTQIVRAHGIDAFTLLAPLRVTAQAFAVSELSRQRAAFQGHRLVSLGGSFTPVERELPAGTVIVPARHALARLAAQLLEAVSDDGLATWGYFGDAIVRAAEAGEGQLGYPVLRLDALPEAASLARVTTDARVFPPLVPYLPIAALDTSLPAAPGTSSSATRAASTPAALTAPLEIEVVTPGERVAARGFEAEPRFAGRELRYRLCGEPYGSVQDLRAGASTVRTYLESVPSGSPVVAPRSGGPIRVIAWRAPGVTHRELVEACEALRGAGVHEVYLDLTRPQR